MLEVCSLIKAFEHLVHVATARLGKVLGIVSFIYQCPELSLDDALKVLVLVSSIKESKIGKQPVIDSPLP
jgi:hypothetical protein